MKNYDYVIVGTSGFISEHLVKKLAKDHKKKILVLGRNKPLNNEVDWEFIDLLKPEYIKRQTTQAANMIYLSATKGRFQPESQEWTIQKKLTAPVFDDLLKTLNMNCDRIMTIGSSEEYGISKDDREITEDSTCSPLTSYGQSKLELYKKGQQWAKKNHKYFLHLRPFIVYGVNQDPTMFLGSLLNSLSKNLEFQMTLGEQWRSFMSVDHFIAVIEKLLELKAWPYDCVNVSSSTYLQIHEVAKLVHQQMGSGRLAVGALPYRSFEVWHQRPSLKRLHEMVPPIAALPFAEDIKTLTDQIKSKK